MPILIFFLIWFLLELFIIIKVASAIGALATIFLLILSALLGSYLIRRQQIAVAENMHKMQNGIAMQADQKFLKQGIYSLLAGILLIIPGFISDIFALTLLFLPLRRLSGNALLRVFNSNVFFRKFNMGNSPSHAYEHENTVDGMHNEDNVIHGELLDKNHNEH